MYRRRRSQWTRLWSAQSNQQLLPLVHSKTALLEGLEVDQYMLGILVYIQKYVSRKSNNLHVCPSHVQ